MGRHLGSVFYQVGEGGAHRARDHSNPQIIFSTLNPNLRSLLHGFQCDRAHQDTEVGLFGLGNLLGAEGEKGPQPAVNPPNL